MKKPSTLSSIKKGDTFSFKGRKKTYTFLGSSKLKGYSYQSTDELKTPYATKQDRDIELK